MLLTYKSVQKKRLQQKMKEDEAKETKKLSEYLKFMNDVKMSNIREALKEVEDVSQQPRDFNQGNSEYLFIVLSSADMTNCYESISHHHISRSVSYNDDNNCHRSFSMVNFSVVSSLRNRVIPACILYSIVAQILYSCRVYLIP